jgi:hypothetical protein
VAAGDESPEALRAEYDTVIRVLDAMAAGELVMPASVAAQLGDPFEFLVSWLEGFESTGCEFVTSAPIG